MKKMVALVALLVVLAVVPALGAVQEAGATHGQCHDPNRFFSGADLSGADLADADLSYCDLFQANLSGANLDDAYLTYANLTSANLTDADLTNADLTGAVGLTTTSGVARWLNTTCPNGTLVGGSSIIIATAANACPAPDTTAPTLSLPAPITAEATGPDGTVVAYTAAATDDQDPAPVVTCSPASDSLFAIGATTVSCTATDAASNSAQGSFTVTVLGAAAQLDNLIAAVQAIDIQQGIGTSLDAKLENIRAALDSAKAKDYASACAKLAAFVNEVDAQDGKELTAAQAAQLRTAAAQIAAVLGC